VHIESHIIQDRTSSSVLSGERSKSNRWSWLEPHGITANPLGRDSAWQRENLVELMTSDRKLKASKRRNLKDLDDTTLAPNPPLKEPTRPL